MYAYQTESVVMFIFKPMGLEGITRYFWYLPIQLDKNDLAFRKCFGWTGLNIKAVFFLHSRHINYIPNKYRE